MVKEQQFHVLVAFLKKAVEIKKAEYKRRCIEQFHSRAICITKTKPFFIWQKLEAQKLWKEIVG